MRRSTAAVVVLCLALVPVTGSSTPSQPRTFRLIVMDLKQQLSDTTSYGTYRAHLAEQIQAASTVFASDKPNLVTLPEDAALMAWLVGDRAIHARETGTRTGNSSAAIASLAATYAPQAAYYEAKCPGIPPARALVLALTDTAWRAFGEPLFDLAIEHDAWITGSANIPVITVTRDPARVALLGDPAIVGKTYAYEGACDVYNTAMVFSPSIPRDADGAADLAKLAVQRKAYLVPIERTQDVGLAMTGERVTNVRPIETPFGRLGILTSKDAWMPDVSERLDDLGMEVMIQPEAGAWAGASGDERAFPPDAMHRAIWGQVQRLPGTRYGALPNLTGNFFDLYFDGTATITKDASSGSGYLLGRLPGPGYVARAGWVVPDPGSCAMADLTCRRTALETAGSTLMPGGAHANGQLEEFVYTDVTLPPTGPFGGRLPIVYGSRVIAPTPFGQWTPQVSAVSATDFWVTWTDLRGGNERPTAILLRGNQQASPTWITGTSPRPNDQQGNGYDARSVALADGTLQTIWTDFRNQGWSIWGARTGGTGFGPQRLVDHSPTSPLALAEGFPTENIHHDPAIARNGNTIYAAWADVRGTRAHAKVAVTRSTDGGQTWSMERRADGSGLLETSETQLRALDPAPTGNQFAPALAVAPNGTLHVAWQDDTNGVPRILLTSSSDGVTFNAPTTVELSPAAQYRPSLAVGSDGSLAVAWEDERSGARAIRMSVDGAPSVAVDAPPAGTTQQRVSVAAVPGGFAVLFQDNRAGDQDVLLTFYAAPSGTFTPIARVDDGPNGADARLPSMATAEDTVAIAWEDARDAVEQIRSVWIQAPAL